MHPLTTLSDASSIASLSTVTGSYTEPNAQRFSSTSIRMIVVQGELIGVLPAHAVSWHRVSLPNLALRGPKLRAVIQGILEDELLDEPSHLHFAIEPRFKAGEDVWVAVCEKSWLSFNLSCLAKNGYCPKRLITECAPLDFNGSLPEAIVWNREECTWITWGDLSGVHHFPLEDTSISTELVYQIPAEKFSQIFVEEDVPSKIFELYPNAVRADLEQRVAKVLESKWNLAQHEFEPRNKLRSKATEIATSIACEKQWLPTRIALIFLAISFSIGTNLVAWKELEHLRDQEKQMAQILHSSFPSVTTIIDPLAQMQKEVEQLRRAVGLVERRDAEHLIAAFGAAPISQDPAILNVKFEYEKKSGLTVTPLVVNEATFSSTKSALQTYGIDLERTNDGLRLVAHEFN